MQDVKIERQELIKKLFPKAFPKLWCPLLTHYKSDGTIDFERICKHLDFIMPHCNSFLIPGSTGDGWELNFEEFKSLINFIFNYAPKKEINILIGLLQTDDEKLKQNLKYALEFLETKNFSPDAKDYKPSRFKGFVICPPKGKNLAQEKIKNYLENFLKLNYPVSLYQLPQITENEMTPETVEYLTGKYPNVFMLKDSSGEDKVAKTGLNYAGLKLIRGAELNYSAWLKCCGGIYDGFLLSTANCFAKEFTDVIERLVQGNQDEADNISIKLTKVIGEVFKLASILPFGNAFTNANKLIDHINAYGKNHQEFPPPKTHSGINLPKELLSKTYDLLYKNGFEIEKGYLS